MNVLLGQLHVYLLCTHIRSKRTKVRTRSWKIHISFSIFYRKWLDTSALYMHPRAMHIIYTTWIFSTISFTQSANMYKTTDTDCLPIWQISTRYRTITVNSKTLTSPFVITVCFFTALFCANFWEPRVPYRKINYVTEWYYVGGTMVCTLASPQSVPLRVHKFQNLSNYDKNWRTLPSTLDTIINDASYTRWYEKSILWKVAFTPSLPYQYISGTPLSTGLN